jgi:hypothetical protein
MFSFKVDIWQGVITWMVVCAIYRLIEKGFKQEGSLILSIVLLFAIIFILAIEDDKTRTIKRLERVRLNKEKIKNEQ